MKWSKHWVSVTLLAISLTSVLGMSLYSIAFAQEWRWKALNDQVIIHPPGKIVKRFF